MSSWKRIAPKSRLDWLVVGGAVAVVVGGLIFMSIVAVTYDGPRRVNLQIDNRSDGYATVFVDGYYSASVAGSQTLEADRRICHATCIVEVTDTEGHVLCTLDLSEGDDESVHWINIYEAREPGVDPTRCYD